MPPPSYLEIYIIHDNSSSAGRGVIWNFRVKLYCGFQLQIKTAATHQGFVILLSLKALDTKFCRYAYEKSNLQVVQLALKHIFSPLQEGKYTGNMRPGCIRPYMP